VKTAGYNIKWDHFDILASGKTDFHCGKIKETVHSRAKAFSKYQRQQQQAVALAVTSHDVHTG
jgi:hypothetical protein